MKKHVPKRSNCAKLPKSFKTSLIWVKGIKNPVMKSRYPFISHKNSWYPAPLADELMREFRKQDIDVVIYKKGIDIFVCGDEPIRKSIKTTLPNALCELYLWAIKEGYIKGGK